MPEFLPYARPSVEDEDIEAVVAVLRSGWLTGGPAVTAFEKEIATLTGARHAIAVSSGTAALHVATLAAELSRGGRLLTSAISFLASANAGVYVGADVDFADVEPGTWNVTADTLERAWHDDTKVVIPVHFAGRPAEIESIAAMAHDRGAVVIDDAAHAIGSAWIDAAGDRQYVGSGAHADMTTFSFHPTKTMTSAEGGAITTNDDDLADRCRLLRSHGMVRAGDRRIRGVASEEPAMREQGPWYYEMAEPGYNYRLSDVHAALGRSQLGRIDEIIATRAAMVSRYVDGFADNDLVVFTPAGDGRAPAWHLFVAHVDFARTGRTRTEVMQELHRRDVGTQVHYLPLTRQPWFASAATGSFPGADAYYRGGLSLPLWNGMSLDDVTRVVEAVNEVVAAP